MCQQCRSELEIALHAEEQNLNFLRERLSVQRDLQRHLEVKIQRTMGFINASKRITLDHQRRFAKCQQEE